MPYARTIVDPRAIAIGTLLALTSASLATGLSYTEVTQSVGGSVTVFDDGSQESDSFWFATSPDPVDHSVSFGFSVDNGIPLAQITMEGGIESTFTSSGFSVFIESNYSFASTTIWGGQFVNAQLSGDASASVQFEITRPTLVAYSLNASSFASFNQIVGDKLVYIDDVFDYTPGDPPATGEVLLQPGTYLLWGGQPFEDDDTPGFFTGYPNNFVELQLTIIPASGTASLLALAALAATRRRR